MISPLPLMRFFTPKKFLGTLRPEYFGGGIFSVKVISIIDYYKRRSKAVKRTLINIAGKGNGREGMYRSNKISYATRASNIQEDNPSTYNKILFIPGNSQGRFFLGGRI